MRCFFRIVFVLILVSWPCADTVAQSMPSAGQSEQSPETAFISSSVYSNAFFGFSLTLPRGVPFRQISIPPNDSSQGFLFGVKADLIKGAFSPRPALSVMEIMYKQAGNESGEAARAFVEGSKKLKATNVAIGGRNFWKSESEENGKSGKMRSLTYAVSLGGYAIEFAVVSFDAKLTGQLERSIESIVFFDPTRAAELAGPGGRLYDPSGRHIATLKPGVAWANTYTNDDLGFTYQFRSGWVVADDATREKLIEAGHQAAWGDSPSAAEEHAAVQKCSRIC